MADKAIPMSYLSKLKEQCDELYQAKGSGGGTNVVANPTETGTEDLTSLQVGNTVYNVPATEIIFSTEASVDAVEVAGFSVAGENFKFPSSGGGDTNPTIPTPTTADNGKVLGVTNGAYALQDAGGGVKLYQHNILLKNTSNSFSNSRVFFSFINDVASPYTTVISVAIALASMNLTLSSEVGLPATGLYSTYSDKVMCVFGSKGGSLTVMISTGSTISMASSPSDKIVDNVTPL